MKRIIDRKVYDTDTAELIHEWDNGAYDRDFQLVEEALYQTLKGTLFVAGEGGALSSYGERHGSEFTGGEAIHVVTVEEAIEWLAANGGENALIEHFSNHLESA